MSITNEKEESHPVGSVEASLAQLSIGQSRDLPGQSKTKDVTDIPESLEMRVPLIKQSSHWDCGVACVKMVLSYMGLAFDVLHNVMKDLDFKQSVWTIDLAYMLKAYGVESKLCTITLGVDIGYRNESYYSKRISYDEKRVTKLFKDAVDKGINVEKRCVKRTEILKHLARGQLIVLLIDWCHLHCIWCENKHADSLCGMKWCHRSTGIYQGHFIVLCGYDQKKNLILFKNPSLSEQLCACEYKNLDNARKQYGTDEDILFVYSDRK